MKTDNIVADLWDVEHAPMPHMSQHAAATTSSVAPAFLRAPTIASRAYLWLRRRVSPDRDGSPL
jgi:hypothetical protein